MDNNTESQRNAKEDTLQPNALQSEAGNVLASDFKWNNNTGAKELLAAVPALEVLGAKAPNDAPPMPQSLPVMPPSDAAGPSRPRAQSLPLDRRSPQDGGPAIDPVYPPDNSRYDKVLTSDGPTIVAKAGDTIWANRGDTIWAYMGSTVYAEAGSKVRAYDGSVVNCYPGSDVHIYAGSRCQIEKGTMVNFEYVGAWQNRRFPEGANVMANQRMYYIPFGQTIGNLYGPFYLKP